MTDQTNIVPIDGVVVDCETCDGSGTYIETWIDPVDSSTLSGPLRLRMWVTCDRCSGLGIEWIDAVAEEEYV